MKRSFRHIESCVLAMHHSPFKDLGLHKITRYKAAPIVIEIGLSGIDVT